MATPLRDVLHIPEELSANDFVLKLSDGVSEVRATLDSYVVTPQLADSFDEALSLVKGALEKNRSDAAFLHGSFGSGKSHFMSVLHAVLRHDPDARGLRDLAPTLAKHDPWLSGRRILCLTYHLVGAETIEAAVLGGYLEQVRRLHPDTPLPEVHSTDSLFADADNLRARLGDEAFFAGLGKMSDPRWGGLAGNWDTASYGQARRAEVGDPTRGSLVSALVGAYFTGYTRGAAYLPLDEGLEAVSAHARRLGYDCVVLFLDELVLWLASRSSDPAFVGREGSKVAKLVESASTHRAVPLVSFVARQRDLRDFLGTNIPGAEKYAIGETFRWWEDRFNQITLEDRNLPVIVKRRLLKERPGAQGALAAAFVKVTREPKVWNVLLEGPDGSSDAAAFQATYPFSPALVATMVALSGLLQRERTALRTMAELLRRGRDELTVDDIIPVGDVYDVLMDSGVVPFTDEMKRHFANARSLYDEKLLPRLLGRHRFASVEETRGLPRTHAFVTDARLVKTALLAALAPGVPALATLTSRKLAALNHGTIVTPLKGEEDKRVLALFRGLAASGVSEIHLADDEADPLISVQLAGVDYESVLERVRNQDTKGERQRLLRELVFESLGVTVPAETLGGAYTHSFVWRGSRRVVDIVYGNIRNEELVGRDALLADGDRWKLVIDFPFDDAGYGPEHDLARFEKLEREGVESRSVAWVPAFFTEEREKDLGELVALRHLLASADRYEQNASHLSVQDRATAKALLSNRKTALEAKLRQVVQQAYGAASRNSADIDAARGHSACFATLEPRLNLGAPVGARLADCLTHLLDQLLGSQYPDHPKFAGEVRRAEAAVVLQYLDSAAAEESGRVPMAARDRDVLRKVANPLGVGEALENAFLFSAETFPLRRHFTQRAAQEGLDEVIGVGRLIEWLDRPQPRGLDPLTRGLVIAAFALAQDREWYSNGSGPVARPPLERIDGSYELRLPRLPGESTWRRAVERAAKLFGVHVTPLRTAANVNRLAADVRERARELQAPARELVTALGAHRDLLGLAEDSGRLSTAQDAAGLVSRLLAEHEAADLAEVLADAPVSVMEEVLAKSLSTAREVAARLEDMDWGLLEAVASMAHDPQAVAALARLREAAARNEFQEPLGTVLLHTRRTAQLILAGQVRPDPAPPGPPAPPVVPGPVDRPGAGTVPAGRDGGEHGGGTAPAPGGSAVSGSVTVEAARIADVVAELRAFAAAHPDAEITVGWSVRP
ncbi:phage resistance protein [Planomonospora venezuelensis]|uniref:Phage resistance protein n=1 Tax=Planomonospora venezuelensis TaxID=1999 RepID=A0A841D4B9_PLAVE|nr:phage resistance protein [Planomonospora venezuelensis]MBB5963247.1 hypothetical protein [Planomonospora venezuelensis]GIN01335.1 hypothetical protein Pve01_29930 [Planomonospora venezuelensis]